MTTQELQEPRVQMYAAPISNRTVKCEVSVLDIYRYITHSALCPSLSQLVRSGVRLSGASSGIIEATASLRAITDTKQARDFKASHFSYALPSGIFGQRTDDGLIHHSNIICLDFDHLGDDLDTLRGELVLDPYFETELLFRSPGGDGLKWWVEVDISRACHRTWYGALCRYVWQTYHVRADATCINPSRACFLPYDAECYVNPKAK